MSGTIRPRAEDGHADLGPPVKRARVDLDDPFGPPPLSVLSPGMAALDAPPLDDDMTLALPPLPAGIDGGADGAIDLTGDDDGPPLPANYVDMTDGLGAPPVDDEYLEAEEQAGANALVKIGTIIADVVGLEWFKDHLKIPPRTKDRVHVTLVDVDGEEWSLRVDNMAEESIGYLKPVTASLLGPLLQAQCIQNVTHIEELNNAGTKMTLRIDVFGYEDARADVDNLFLSDMSITYVPFKEREYDEAQYMLSGTRRTDSYQVSEILAKNVEGGLEQLFTGVVDLQSIKFVKPHAAVLPQMYPYQVHGLQWMMYRETKRSLLEDQEVDEDTGFIKTDSKSKAKSDRFLLWERRVDDKGNRVYYNQASKTTQKEPPCMPRGGILADEMGLGKTLQMVALVAASCRSAQTGSNQAVTTAEKGKLTLRLRLPVSLPSLSSSSSSSSSSAFALPSASAVPDLPRGSASKDPSVTPCTLIVCPTSLLHTTWQKQFEMHVRPGHLSVYVYHGPQRNRDPDILKLHDVIVTTYTIVRNEWRNAFPEEGDKKKERKEPVESPLYEIKWLRIILDEAHEIRDRNSAQSRACCALRAERRWCMTGTPFQNRISDVYPLLKFLRVEPFSINFEWFRKLIVAPLQQADARGLDSLKIVLQHLCLRRKKTDRVGGKELVSLPKKIPRVVRVELEGRQQELYKFLEGSSKDQFQDLLDKKGVTRHFAFVLEMVLRLRQACTHPELVPKKYLTKGFRPANNSKADFVKSLLQLLKDGGSAEVCQLCSKPQCEDMVVTKCIHFFCHACLFEALELEQKCPTCMTTLRKEDVVTERTQEIIRLQEEEEEKFAKEQGFNLDPDADGKTTFTTSAKLEGLMRELAAAHTANNKCVVFSQWTSFLDLIQSKFEAEGIVYARLDGGMSHHARRKALTSFQEDARVRVFLISLKAGGVGLTLTAANRVFLMDPWWNPAAEDQAIDRIHRIGQKKEVEVVRFIAKNSIEEKIVALQQSKREMINHALAGRTQSELKAERLKDLVSLFQ